MLIVANATRAPKHDAVSFRNGYGNAMSDARADGGDEQHQIEDAARRYVVAVIYPLWVAAGFADYLTHRQTRIERNAGLPESLLHASQMTLAGIPVLAAMFFDVNALTLAIMLGSLAAHEVSSIVDVAYAEPRRGVTTTEQHLHGMLEMLPVGALSVLMLAYRRQALAMLGLGDEAARWKLEAKPKPLKPRTIALVLGGVALFVGLPYVEELVRCARTKPDAA
jgi:hypothetical protein